MIQRAEAGAGMSGATLSAQVVAVAAPLGDFSLPGRQEEAGMESMEWLDATPVGLEVIDEQHRQLADSIGRLYGAIHRRRRDALLPHLAELEAYAQSHFETEEHLMREHRYPARAAEFHIAQHREFRRYLGLLKRDVEAGKWTARLDVLQFLAKWWSLHVQSADKQLAQGLNTDGTH